MGPITCFCGVQVLRNAKCAFFKSKMLGVLMVHLGAPEGTQFVFPQEPETHCLGVFGLDRSPLTCWTNVQFTTKRPAAGNNAAIPSQFLAGVEFA